MGLFNREKTGETDDERYAVLTLAKDEDYTLYEFITRIGGDPARVRAAVNELTTKGMVEIVVVHPNRERQALTPDQATNVLNRRNAWAQSEPGTDKFLVVA